MASRPFQYGISALMACVAFAAFNFWLCTHGAWGIVLVMVIDKHIVVAYLCWRLQVDRRRTRDERAASLRPAA